MITVLTQLTQLIQLVQFFREKGATAMRLKILPAILPVFLCAAALLWWNIPDAQPAKAAEDEIMLRIKLSTKEDIGLLLIDYDANGSGGRGGISNANKSLLRRDEQLYYALPEHAFDNPSDVENLSVQFTVITEYAEPNYEAVYPEENTIPLEAISLKANFGQSYSIAVIGDMANGYKAVLLE